MSYIGIINFNKKKPTKLIDALIKLKYQVISIEHYQDYVHIVRKLDEVKHWILYGDDYYVTKTDDVNMDLFSLDKYFLLYSSPMHSFMKTKGASISDTSSVHKGEIQLPLREHYLLDNMAKKKNMSVYRHHKHYITEEHKHLDVLNKHKNMIMTATYKDSTCKNIVVLVQWIPERTLDGQVFLDNWICDI